MPMRQRVKFIALAIAVLVLAAVTAFSFINFRDAPQTSAPGDGTTKPLSSRSFVVYETPRTLPTINFEDGSGRALTLAAWEGKTVLLNIWATWCTPCREEMPTLDSLESILGGPAFEVVPLSIDRAGPEAVRKFYTETAIENLGLYIDASSQASFDLGVQGLPTTLLIDAKGRELGRLVGPAEWDAPEMIDFLKSHMTTN